MVLSADQPSNFFTHDPDHHRILLNIHLQPGAKSSAIAGLHGNALKIRIAAPAIDNKANTALVAFLSKLLGVPKGNISIRSGLHSRDKRIEIVGAIDHVVAQLRAAVAELPT